MTEGALGRRQSHSGTSNSLWVHRSGPFADAIPNRLETQEIVGTISSARHLQQKCLDRVAVFYCLSARNGGVGP